jgi:hypothetical protein
MLSLNRLLKSTWDMLGYHYLLTHSGDLVCFACLLEHESLDTNDFAQPTLRNLTQRVEQNPLTAYG